MACLFTHKHAKAFNQNETLTITALTYPGDTVTVTVWDYYYGERKQLYFPWRHEEKSAAGGTCTFSFQKIKGPVYFSIEFKAGMKRSRTLQPYLAFPGDSLAIRQQGYKYLSFSGSGSQAATCRYIMDSISLKTGLAMSNATKSYEFLRTGKYLPYVISVFAEEDSCMEVQKKVLFSYRRKLSRIAFDILRADMIARNSIVRCDGYSRAMEMALMIMKEDSAMQTRKVLSNYFLDHFPDPTVDLPTSFLVNSRFYVKAIALLTYHKTRLYPGVDGIRIIKQLYSGALRDAVLTVFLTDYTTASDRMENQVAVALEAMTTPHYKEALTNYRNKYLKGVTAYNFSLPDVNGKTRTLKEFRGKRVVIDFWFTGCSGCSQLYVSALKEVEKRLEGDTSIVFVSIAKDSDRNTWMNSIAKDIYTSRTAVNLFLGTTSYEHPTLKNYSVNSYPTVIVIDEKGKIVVNQNPPRTPEELLAFIRQ